MAKYEHVSVDVDFLSDDRRITFLGDTGVICAVSKVSRKQYDRLSQQQLSFFCCYVSPTLPSCWWILARFEKDHFTF